MDARWCCFAVDVVDDVNGTLEHLQSGLGGAGVVFAAAYHTARDVLPRNARRRVHFSPAGLAFPPDAARYPRTLPPPPMLPVCGGRDVLAEVVDAARARGMRSDAWVVYLHHDDVSSAPMAGRVRNAFGDDNPVALCPAAPDVQAYATALTEDVCSRGPDGIFAEALHYLPFVHGFHHERVPAWLGGLARLLLGMCFCDRCTAAARSAGVDADALAAWVRDIVDGTGRSAPPPALDGLIRRADAELMPGTLAGFLALRQQHVESLIGSCAAVAGAAGVAFTVFDGTHALAEHNAGREAPGWQLGVDLGGLAEVAAIATAFYCEDAEQFAAELATALRCLGRAPSGALLRVAPLPPALDLRTARDALAAAGVEWVGYYHYGLAPEAALAAVAALPGEP